MKSVVLVGTNTPIGHGLCRKYARLGWKIAIVEWTQNARAAQHIVDECLSAGSPKAILLKGELSKETEWRKIVTAINQQIGEAELIIYLDKQKIDRLFKEVHQGTVIKKLFDNNYFGPVFAIHNFLSTLRRTNGQFVLTGFLEDKENALDYSSYQAVHGFVNTVQREEKNINFSFFYPNDNAQENAEENVDLLINSINQKKSKICMRDTNRVQKRRESVHLEIEIDDPPALKPDSANPLCKAIFKNNKIEARDVMKNSRNIVGLLEEKDEDGRTALHYTCYIGCGEMFTLIAKKIKVKKLFNEQDKFGCSPLHLSAFRGHINICRKLIMRHGADPNILSSGNMSALHYLARLDPMSNQFYSVKMKNSFEKTLKVLMDGGADSNQRNTNWGTPLHEAARAGSLLTVAFLIKNEGDLYRKTLDGNETPLHLAIRSGNRKAIGHLLDNGADPCAACVNGTCFDIAPTASVCDLLEQYREKNRRQSDTFHARETVVVETLQDLPSDAQKMIANSRLTEQELLANFDTLLFVLRFLTKRNYIKRGDPLPTQTQRKIEVISKTSLGISLQQATERFITSGNPRKLFKIIEDAGRGGFGTVYKARRLDDKKIVAIKKVPHLSDKEQWNNFDEIHFLQQMGNHGNVVRYHTSYFSRDELWIIMEYLEGGTLSEVISRVKLDENNICYITKNILKGLKDMHKMKVIHRDLKSANIMLNVGANVKLIDFGLCIDVSNYRPEFMVGSPFWIPPEMIHKIPHGPAADIWSLGILCLEMANRGAPNRYSSLKAMYETGIGSVPKLDNEEKWTKSFRSFLDRMLVINPDQRASAKDLLEDPWIKNISRTAVGDMREVLRSIFLEKSLELSMV